MLAHWQVFIIMSCRSQVVRNAAEVVYETRRCGNNNLDNRKFISITAGRYNEIIFPRNEAPNPRANVFYSLDMRRTDTLRCDSGSLTQQKQQRIPNQVLMTFNVHEPHKVTQCE